MPSDVQVITSFSPAGLDVYGRTFIHTFCKYWPKNVLLWVGVEGPWPNGLGDERVRYFDLSADMDMKEFLAYTRGKYGEDHPTNYARQPMKFAKKVFALTQPHLWNREAHNAKWWVWIDADVETIREVPRAWMERIFRDDRSVIYLARPEEKHSETGFIAFNLQHKGGLAALLGMRQYYVVNGHPRVFDLEHWHDSMVLDAVLAEQGTNDTYSLNKVRGSHVWPGTVLGDVMRHNKGFSRKEKAYGKRA